MINQPSQTDNRKETPSIVYEEVNIKDSSGIYLGKREVYNGNVTINQVVRGVESLKCLDDGFVPGNGHPQHGTVIVAHDRVPGHLGVFNGRNRISYLTAAFLLLAVSGFLIRYLIRDYYQKQQFYHDYPQDQTIHFVTRSQWRAKKPFDDSPPLHHPVEEVIISHTVTSFCFDEEACTQIVKTVQALHTNSFFFTDIGYHFLIGGEGSVYIGRGWDVMGEHTRGHNSQTICIAFVGTFTNTEPSEEQVSAALKLLDLGVRIGKLSREYKVYNQCQLRESLSPGKYLRRVVSNWTHHVPSTAQADLIDCDNFKRPIEY